MDKIIFLTKWRAHGKKQERGKEKQIRVCYWKRGRRWWNKRETDLGLGRNGWCQELRQRYCRISVLWEIRREEAWQAQSYICIPRHNKANSLIHRDRAEEWSREENLYALAYIGGSFLIDTQMELTKLLAVYIWISKAETHILCGCFQHMGGVRVWGYMRRRSVKSVKIRKKSVKIRRLSVGPKEHII